LDSIQVSNLKNDPLVASVTPNIYGKIGIRSSTLYESKKEESLLSMQTGGQILPWGVERVRGPYDGIGKTAWVMDTGIDFTHPDLNVDVSRSISFISGEDANDINGHGTHVAGIIAAIDNDIGVVGVAAGATVISVKVCNQSGNCPKNSFLDGIEYVAENAKPHDIVNVSLWWPADSDLDNAVIDAASHGIPFTLIAGNASGNANNFSPGRATHYNIKTMSAFDENDMFAPFSNFGNPPINFSGPGVNILSTSVSTGSTCTQGGETGLCSGTSMAAPHVAGILLAVGPFDPNNPLDNPVPTDGTVTGDPDGNPDIIAVLPSDLSVFISGSSFVTNGQTGHWTANVSGGEPPFSFRWFRNSTQPPHWQQVGTGSSYSQVVTQSFQLKVRVSDAGGTTVTSNVFNVSTSSQSF